MTRRPAPTRFARASLLAVTSAALSVAAHGAAGGEVTEFAPALPLTVLIALASTAVRGRGPWTLLPTLGIAQVAQHTLLNLGHHEDAGAGLGFGPAAMFAAHVVAALLTGLLLVRADAVLDALVWAVSRLLPVLWSFAPAVAPTSPVRAAPVPDVWMSVLLRRVHGRRGPPYRS
ncbi:hypothetical protein ACQPW3_00250 [Actinosynnema sp. CA-248983]